MSLLLCCAAASALGPSPIFEKEASRLTDLTMATFYDPKAKIWKPPVESSEAVGLQGYTFWPSLLAWQAIIEGAKVNPKIWKPKIATYYKTLEQYYDSGQHAYCAWTYFPGNDDHFYDDNTWAVVACIEAYDVTGNEAYRSRGIEIMDKFVKGGWDASGNPGGMRWGTKALPDRSDRTVSATAAGALAALLVAKTYHAAENQAFAKKLLDWIHDRLSADNGLIYDGFKSPAFTRMPTIWTYNTGVPIRAAVEYHAETHDSSYLQWAIKMGNAAIDRANSPLYDGSVKDASKRYWYDSGFFVQYLVDGLRSLSRATHDEKYSEESRRNAEYCLHYLKDSDGLYWRNMRLWTIDADCTSAFHTMTGQFTPELAADPSERSMTSASMKLPVQDRPMVKTLLANAGAARMFWLLSH
jgi:predicted alpha-1,6-mannanase (GH76 family)